MLDCSMVLWQYVCLYVYILLEVYSKEQSIVVCTSRKILKCG